jgi:very-short-patch-repair endonuclease
VRAEQLAADQDGVVSRAQLRGLGIGKDLVRTHVRAGRWKAHGRHTVAVHTGGLGVLARRWRAVWESGADAALDGVSALHAAGLTGFDEEVVHVSVSHRRAKRRPDGVCVHESRLRGRGDLVGAGIPRVRAAVAVVRAALWARSDRQAALLIVMTVQQRLARPEAVRSALESVPRYPRKAFVARIVEDVADGAQALGELDFAQLCRARGLPEPSRQVVRRGQRGRIYLDVCWEDIGLVVEIDGIHHGRGLAPVDDALRQNAVTLARDLVLRVPLLGLRLEPDAFLDQVEKAHLSLRTATAAPRRATDT